MRYTDFTGGMKGWKGDIRWTAIVIHVKANGKTVCYKKKTLPRIMAYFVKQNLIFIIFSPDMFFPLHPTGK